MSKDVKSVMVNEKVYHLPFLEEVPYDNNDLTQLALSIEESGEILVPVVCWKEQSTSTSETVVDGAHRVLEAYKLELKIPVVRKSYRSIEDAREDCLRMNHDRRHLTQLQREDRRQKRLARVAEARAAGKSLRTIAQEEGISKSQVERDLEEASTVPGGTVGAPDGKVKGQDGRTRTAKPSTPTLCKRCKRVGAVKNCPLCAKARNQKGARDRKKRGRKGALKDNHGTVVPERCRAAWGDKWIQQTFDFLCVWADKFREERIADGMHQRAKHYPFIVAKDVIDGCGFISNYLDDLITQLKTRRPDGVCPACSGEGCASCRMCGLVPREEYTELKKVKA